MIYIRCSSAKSVMLSDVIVAFLSNASVRAEKNRCARNCFLCPNCRNTLSVVPSDPTEDDGNSSSIQLSTIGEPPFFLYCNHCRWDSTEVGITFEKPTGLAAQLQRSEDSAPDSLEFERLKEHFEPFLRTSSLSSSQLPTHTSHSSRTASLTAAASAALARDIPGVGRYTSNAPRGRANKDKSVNKDEMPEYKSRVEVGASGMAGDADFMKHIEDVSEVASLEQRWANSWKSSLQSSELKPLRIPLHSKTSKRCPTCTHILIKPEQKAQSVRYKIKLVAANYLPAITVALPHMQSPDTAKRTANKEDDRPTSATMMAGKTYPFHLALTNPLYDPIQVRLSVQRMHVAAASASDGTVPEKARRPPFAISLPTTSFPIAAFAEAWEYEDDEDMLGLDDDELGIGRRDGKDKDGRGKVKAVGVLEKKANLTVVGGEVVIGKEARGNVKFNMLVSYTYRADDPAPSDDNDVPRSPTKGAEVKTFSFYTVIDLGAIISRETTQVADDI
ncbi:hypothetical protein HWV62_161 [Athelia sp. TMB]|nr:hypothetical protein HWV62_161 [Athelia sp. TMB]